jgi:teichuronic acid biosynthesis glycosyltransferase TuaC
MTIDDHPIDASALLGAAAPPVLAGRTARGSTSETARRIRAPILEFVHRDEGADVLVITNMWPDDERPVYGIFVQRQVESLRARGLRCDVLYLRGYTSGLAYPRAALQLLTASIAWRRRYRLVHVHAGETALAARFFLGVPMLVSYGGDDVLGDQRDDGRISRMSRIRAAAIRAHGRLFAATITKSTEMQDRLPPFVRRKNSVLPNGVDPEVFKPTERSEARALLSWDGNARVALFAATKPDRKRRGLAEAACAHASRRLGPVRLHVASQTPPRLMPVLMSACDCLVHTASLEGSSNVVKEALMCNLPVVATPAGDVGDLLKGVTPSYLCRPVAAEIGEAIVDCLRQGVRSDGRVKAMATLSADVVASRLFEIYRRFGVRVAHSDDVGART